MTNEFSEMPKYIRLKRYFSINFTLLTGWEAFLSASTKVIYAIRLNRVAFLFVLLLPITSFAGDNFIADLKDALTPHDFWDRTLFFYGTGEEKFYGVCMWCGVAIALYFIVKLIQWLFE